ncbi:MAG: Ig-like domain-containing protein [Bacteroidota bacterium]
MSFLAILFSSNLRAQTNIWVSAYYAGWQQGYNNYGYLPAQNVDYSAVTHIFHFALVPHNDGSLDDASNSVTAFNANALIPLAHAAGKKVIITVGGWGTDVNFRSATNPATLPVFVSNLVNLMQARGYDGIDIDWEVLASSDSTQYKAFITSLRTALDGISPRPLLTAATQWEPAIFASVADKFDQINIMTYDLSGAWPGWVTWHNSPVSDGGFNFPSTGRPIPSANGMVDNFASFGIPITKLGIGIDFYGYIWSGGTGMPNGGATDPRQSWTSSPSVQSNVAYYNIMKSYYQPQYYRWDTLAQASYLSIDNPGSANDKFISYDNEITCQKKITYARTKGIGGVIIWELGGGYQASNPPGQQDLLLQAVKHAMNGNYVPGDTIPPSVSITVPVNKATVSNTITINANASDDSWIVGVQFQLNGINLGNELGIPPYSYPWNTRLTANGSYTLSAMAVDAGGNKATSSINVIVYNVPDTIAPVVSMSSPLNGATVSTIVAVSAIATDNVGVAGVQFKVNGNNLGAEVQFSPYTVSWNTSLFPNGVDTLSAVARDDAGNTSTASVVVTVYNVPDSIAPVVSISTPSNGAIVSSIVTITAQATDNVGVAGVQFKLNGSNLGSEVASPPYSYLWNTTTQTNGSYTISAVARDAAGNKSSASITVNINNNASSRLDSIYHLVVQDNFDRPDAHPVSGGKWITLLNQPGGGRMDLLQHAIQPYNQNGIDNAGGVAWDSLLTKGSGVGITVARRSSDNNFTSLFIYLRMAGKDLNTGDGYRFRYLDDPTGNALLAIQRVQSGTIATDLVATNYHVTVGDTLRFIAQNDSSGTLLAFVNSVQVLTTVDTMYNPSSWYTWLRGFVLSTVPRYTNFNILGVTPTQPVSFPSIPIPAEPANGTIGVACNTTTSWQKSPQTTLFRLQLSLDSTFTTITFDTGGVTNNIFTFNGLRQASTYYWRVQASNIKGITTWSPAWSFVTGTGWTSTYSLNRRWNLVSLPVRLSNPRIDVQFPLATSLANNFIPNNGYRPEDTLVNGAGYWLKFDTDQQVSLTGDSLLVDTLDVIDGWNLIGSISSPVELKSVTTIGTSISSKFFGYRSGYTATDTMKPAKGYWVKVNGTGKLVINSSGSALKAGAEVPYNKFLKHMNSLTINDADENSQTLYFGYSTGGNVPVQQFELPPIPPKGVFDARFATGGIAEFANRSEVDNVPLMISSDAYPILITWKTDQSAQCNAKLSIDGKDLPLSGEGYTSITNTHSHIQLIINDVATTLKPVEFSLEQNYPNPFNPQTIIKYGLPMKAYVILQVFNILGERIATLADGVQELGFKSVEWNSGNYPSGIYFYRLEASGIDNPLNQFTQVQKMILIK